MFQSNNSVMAMDSVTTPAIAASSRSQSITEKAWCNAIWQAFATTLGRSLSFLGRRPALAVLAGTVAIPLNYWAGQRLGAVEFGYPVPVTLAIMSLVWAVMLPVMFRLTALIGSASGSEELT